MWLHGKIYRHEHDIDKIEGGETPEEMGKPQRRRGNPREGGETPEKEGKPQRRRGNPRELGKPQRENVLVIANVLLAC